MSGQVRCAEEGCENEATVTLTLAPRFEADPPIQGWYVERLQRRHPEVVLDFHEDCHFLARIESCERHVEDLATLWNGWLYGEWDPVTDDEAVSVEELALFGWSVAEDGRMTHDAVRPGPPPPVPSMPPVVAGGSDEGQTARRAARKRARAKRVGRGRW